MRNVTPRITLATLVAWLTLGGCSVLAPQRDPSRFFTLSPMTEAGLDAKPPSGSGGTSRLTYGLGPVTLAAYLDRNEIATRVNPTEVVYSPTERWAEPPESEIARTLLRNLSALLGPDRIVPWPTAVRVDRQIEVAVLRFERVGTGACELTARWSVKDLHTGRLVVLKESTFTHPAASPGAAETVSALSADVADLSREIAQQLSES
jgi:uncharacterized lipoprotein YmbA